MDPATVATITGLAAATKSAIDAALAVLAKGKGREAEKAVKEAQGLIEGLKARLFELEEVSHRLLRELGESQEENRHLREQIRRKEEGSADRERYERRRVGESVVVVAKAEPETYLCATCYEDGKKVYLTKVPSDMSDVATHYCPKCKGLVGAQ